MENDLISRKALLDTLQNHFGQDLAYIQQLERERDALLTALRKTDTMCEYCKHGDMMRDTCEGDCSFCDHSETCQCRECDGDIRWEWAGIKEVAP